MFYASVHPKNPDKNPSVRYSEHSRSCIEQTYALLVNWLQRPDWLVLTAPGEMLQYQVMLPISAEAARLTREQAYSQWQPNVGIDRRDRRVTISGPSAEAFSYVSRRRPRLHSLQPTACDRSV